VGFEQLVKLMVDHDLSLAKQESEARALNHVSAATRAGWGSI